tara:strand:+ start:883 stop:1497 length:615 start_codon:yes stop_codon:yes gene_type:complete
MAITTVSLLKEYLPEVSGASLDTELARMINRTEVAIARYLGFPVSDSGTAPSLDQTTYTVYLDGPKHTDNQVIQMPVKPLVSVASIHSDINLAYGSDTLITASTYQIDTGKAQIFLLPDKATKSFDRGFRALKVVCSAGYSVANPPDDLVHAVLVWCSALQRAKANQGKDSITQRNSTVRLSPRQMPTEVRELVKPFMNPFMVL